MPKRPRAPGAARTVGRGHRKGRVAVWP